MFLLGLFQITSYHLIDFNDTLQKIKVIDKLYFNITSSLLRSYNIKILLFVVITIYIFKKLIIKPWLFYIVNLLQSCIYYIYEIYIRYTSLSYVQMCAPTKIRFACVTTRPEYVFDIFIYLKKYSCYGKLFIQIRKIMIIKFRKIFLM